MPLPTEGLTLHGNERSCLDDGSLSTLDLNAVFITMNDDALGVFQTSVAQGDRLDLITGPSPQIQIGDSDTPLNLRVSLEQFRHEIYTNKVSSARLDFRSLVTQRAECQVDQSYLAMQAVRTSMAAIASEQESRKAVTRNDVMFDAKKKRTIPPVHRGLNGPRLEIDSASAGRTPNAGSTPSPTSGEVRQKAMTKVITHFLASRPASDEDIYSRTSVPARDRSAILQRSASFDTSTQKWVLKDRAYKDIRIWDFKWPRASDREAAIEAAVRAYDRLRLGKDDDLWQFLLPKEERDKGKVLSRLHSGVAQKPQVPSIRPPTDQGSDTPRVIAGDASPMPSSAMPLNTASPAAPHSKPGSLTPAGRSNLEAVLKGSKKPTARVTAALKDPKEPSKDKSDSKPSKFKSSEYITESDEEGAVSSGDSVDSGNAARRAGVQPAPKSQSSQPVRSTKGASPPVSLLGSGKPVIRKIAKTSSFNGVKPSNSAQTTPSNRAEKHANKANIGRSTDQNGALTPAERDPKQKLPSPARRPGSPQAAAASKEMSSVGRKRALASEDQQLSRPSSASKKRELPESDIDSAARPRKVSKMNGSSTVQASGRRDQVSSTKVDSQRHESTLKRKPETLSRSTFDDYDRQRARKQGRADSSSVNSAATSSSIGTSASNATTAPTSLGSPSFSAHSPASLADSNTSNSSRESSLARHTSKWTLARALDEAERFQERYYPEYTALYDRVEKQGRYARPEDRKQLLAMHDRLKLLKHNITLAAG